MVKLCIVSEEVRMSGDIDITAQFRIITKAKLDSISVAGNCECDGPVEKDEIHDFVFVIDGSGLVLVILRSTGGTALDWSKTEKKILSTTKSKWILVMW